MKASYLWIKDYLPTYRDTPAHLAHALTMSGTEVESVEEHGRDHRLDVGVTSNRVDCLCHVGLAREVSAVTRRPLVPPRADAEETGRPTAGVASVSVEDAELCPRYTARVLEGVRVGPSPSWLVERLDVVGVRPVNLVVDVTNFVLFELNQPLHAFDLDRIGEGRVVVRRARAGEVLRAINAREYVLSADDLVIADARGPIALAGVMGGLESEVSDATSRILIESACFSARSVRRTARRHQVHSDASHRFERGVDREGALAASARAATLIMELGGGVLCQGPIDVGGPGPRPAPIAFRVARIKAVSGVSIPASRAAELLERLECKVATAPSAGVLEVTPPTFRGDLRREIDLVEEITRLVGLERVPERSSMTILQPPTNERRRTREAVKDRMVAMGFLETVTPDFVADGIAAEVVFLGDASGLVVENPVRAGEASLRRSLLPSLLRVRKHNQDQGNDDLRFFELSNVHGRSSAGGPVHRLVLGFLLDGDLRDARGVMEEILRAHGIAATFEATDAGGMDPRGRAAVRFEDRCIGVLGYPSRALIRTFGLKVKEGPVYGELSIDDLVSGGVAVKRFKELPRYPAVDRDLAVIVGDDIAFGAIAAATTGLGLPNLDGVTFLDEYRGKQVGEGRKSIAYRLTFRSAVGTLTAAEVDAQIGDVVRRLGAQLGAEVRGT